MSTIRLECKVSLSKKLRSMLGNSGSLNLVVNDVRDGNGIGSIIVNSDNINVPVDIKSVGETSIMLTPLSADDSIGEVSQGVSSLFDSFPPKGKEDPVTRKIAVVNAPEKKEVPRAVKERVNTPEQFRMAENKSFKKWIANLDELKIAIDQASHKVSNINLDGIANVRERAVAREAKERQEAIDSQAYIVCDKAASLSINDLDISLRLNMPFDLSNISAKRLALSKDLRSLVNSGLVKFINPSEVESYIQKVVEPEQIGGLNIFDNHEEAEDAIINAPEKTVQSTQKTRQIKPTIQDSNDMDINVEDIDSPTEEEQMILDLTRGRPTESTSRSTTRTRHSYNNSNNSNNASNSSVPSIRRKI